MVDYPTLDTYKIQQDSVLAILSWLCFCWARLHQMILAVFTNLVMCVIQWSEIILLL